MHASTRALGAGLLALSVLGSSARADAFCRTTTCDPGSTGADACRWDDGCLVGGLPLYWKQPCVSFSVQQDGSPLRGITYDEANRIIANALFKWTTADCGGAAPSLAFSATQPVSCHRQEYNSDAPNANIWMFRDDAWPYDDDGWTLALTTITFDTKTGEIYDTDVEINSFAAAISTDGSATTNDLAAIVTHEAGHVMGLSHSTDPRSTMVESYREGTTTLRVLAADDIAGVCAVYPPGRPTTACDSQPRHGFSTECAPPDSGCSCRAPRGTRAADGAMSAALLLLAFLRRRSA
jgi:hypothetical protein